MRNPRVTTPVARATYHVAEPPESARTGCTSARRGYEPPERVWRCGGYVTGGAVCTGAGCAGDADVEPRSVPAGEVAGGAVATGVFTDGVLLLLPDDEDARSAKKSENAATSATPAPASQRVVDEIRRMPLSRSAGRCGATRLRSIVRRRPEDQPVCRRYE